uniref:ribonuclease H n=1 Tax=Oreochromis niloticus TaxID=8128 RepID=A0A669DIS8_ORENI
MLQFYVFQAPLTPLVLGFPWLHQHNPVLDWKEERVLGWGEECHMTCLKAATPVKASNPLPQEPPDLSAILSEYHDLKQVFCKDRARSLPPHRPYDCSIDLLPGAPLPTSRLYSLSQPERECMEKYINESLAEGLIRPSSSPVAAGFFFVTKKDKSLRPCIDFQGLNNITIKNKYPLPLLSSAFELLQGATIFTKLDLRNAYHLVRIREGDEWKTAFNTHLGHFEYLVMPFGLTNAPAVFQGLVNDVLQDFINRFVFVYLDDILIFSHSLSDHVRHVRQVLQRLLENRLFVKGEKCEFHVSTVSFLGYIIEQGDLRTDPAKVQAVLDWPTPPNRKQLQRFLGFANFYRRFIRDYSKIGLPLTCLTSPKVPFCWDDQAQEAFSRLKKRFTSAPILRQPDLKRQFTVEVDALDVGVGAVLSQQLEGKLHPCAYFSRRLSPAEQNYDIGDRELLAIKLALEEWRHWLEGTTEPFVVWTDHKNLEYIRSAKRLNARQARWALFFTRFCFTITYRPGSRDVKPNALSRQFTTSEDPIAAQVSLLSGFHPQTNGQAERANQELKAALRCLTSTNQTTWSEQLMWVEYAHNSLTSSATGVSLFEASLGYQPPLFPAIEGENFMPSVQQHLRRCQRAWRATRAALLRTADRNKQLADHHRTPAPAYSPGQKVWLLTRYVPLRTESQIIIMDWIYIALFKAPKALYNAIIHSRSH